MNFDSSQLMAISPLLIVLVSGLGLLMLESFAITKDRRYLTAVTLVGIVVAAVAQTYVWSTTPEGGQLEFSGLLQVDKLSSFLNFTFLLAAGLCTLLAGGFMREHEFEFGEFYSLVMLGTAGMMIMSAAEDLVAVFIGVETMSLAVYVLTGSWRRAPKSSEGAMKYFVVGAVASAFLVYGIALVYGTAGTTNLAAIGKATHAFNQPVFLIGMIFIIATLAFKVSAVPFHMWAPDAYEGAPTPVTAFMATAVKAAGFVTMIRLFSTAFGSQSLMDGYSGWATIIGVLAVLTMSLGNLTALLQENVKRMLAYSSISHAGYLLIGVLAMSLVGAEARGPILFYLVSYTVTTIGAFAVVAYVGRRGDERLLIEDDWAGLAARHPGAALAMTVFMLSLAGVPPTAGFFGKFYVFRAALAKPGLTWLVVIAVANSLVSFYYYLRVVMTMYFREPGRQSAPIAAAGITAALIITAVATLFIGLGPNWLVEAARAATLAQ